MEGPESGPSILDRLDTVAAMALEFQPFERTDAARLASFLAGNPWPFHAGGVPTAENVLDRVEHGEFDDESTELFWILDDGAVIGTVRLFDLEDETPLFDLRLAESARGQGIGTASVRWLTGRLFETRAQTDRIEATTRADNVVMRTALERVGYVKESHWRRAWPDVNGGVHDGVGYGMLRDDWISGSRTPVDWDDHPSEY